MTKHVHAEMIKAKVDNMDLVVFVKGDAWNELNRGITNLKADKKYFICHPTVKKQTLHWLSGGELQHLNERKWIDHKAIDEFESDVWRLFISPRSLRIKPKKEKEKRWIGVRSDDYTTRAYDSEHDCSDETDRRTDYDGIMGWEIIEIEVEV